MTTNIGRSNVSSDDPDYNGATTGHHMLAAFPNVQNVICVGGCPEDFCNALFKH